jgi:gliding motility-associated-like protein
MNNKSFYCRQHIPNQKAGVFWLVMGLMFFHTGQAQFSNGGSVSVTNGTIVSVYEDYVNKLSGNFINDGNVYIFKNWGNDGQVSFTSTDPNGSTYFQGSLQQFISGNNQSDFQNVVFNNSSANAPFNLGTKISVNNIADFQNGVVNGVDYAGLMIFNANAEHQDVRDQSFVDGRVQKIGNKEFEFPVGSGTYFRPSYHGSGNSVNAAYTTQYFYENSNSLYDHSKKQPVIELINDKEYWKVSQDSETEKIVLSLTIDSRTTPAAFSSPSADFDLVIVRWDEAKQKWISEGGVVSDPKAGKTYEQLLTAEVTNYGIFTMGLIKKANPDVETLIVHNGISPNGDNLNDAFLIEGIDKYPDNEVEIYNRWGIKVYTAKSYNESDVMFRGYSDGRATIQRNEKLPTGTYFYILKYNNGKKQIEQKGYLYINSN